MKHISNIQFTSPEADRRVMLWISMVLMIPFWLLLGCFGWIAWHAVFTEEWNIGRLGMAVFLAVLVVFGIPFQFSRYFRELRALRASRREL